MLAVLELAVGIAIIFICLRGWFTRDSLRLATAAINSSLRDGRYAASATILASTVIDAILNGSGIGQRKRWRLSLFSIALLLGALSMSDISNGTLLGTKESPWKSYDRFVALMVTSQSRPPSNGKVESPAELQARNQALHVFQIAQSPPLKYFYAVVFCCVIALANFFFLFMSLLLTKHVIGEMISAQSWTMRLGLVGVLILGAAALALGCTLVVGLFCNPAVWLVLLLAKLGASVAWLIVGLAGALAFEWWAAGPWFKALMIATLLPASCVLLVAFGEVLDTARRQFVALTGQTVVAPMLERYGGTLVPWSATGLIVISIGFLLWLLP